MVSLDDVIAVRSSLVDRTEDRYRDLPHIAPDTIERDTRRLFPYKDNGEARSHEWESVRGGRFLLLEDPPESEQGDTRRLRRPLQRRHVCLKGRSNANDGRFPPPSPTKPSVRRLRYEPVSRANIPKVNRDQLLSFQFDLPPLDEQRRIAAILDRAGRLRALQAGAAKLSDEVALSQFERLRTASVCQTMKLSDAYSFQEGPGVRKWQFTSAGVKLLNVGNIVTGGRLDLTKTDRYLSCDEAYGKRLPGGCGDLVIASSGITFGVDGLLSTRAAFEARSTSAMHGTRAQSALRPTRTYRTSHS